MSESLEAVFSSVLLASRDATILALAIGTILFGFGQKIPPAWRHGLWMLVVIRLLLPSLPDGALSWQRLLPAPGPAIAASVPAEPRPPERDLSTPLPEPELELPPAAPIRDASIKMDSDKTLFTPAVNPLQIDWKRALLFAWLVGALGYLLLIFTLDFRFRRRVRILTEHDARGVENARDLLDRVAREQRCRPPTLRITRAVSVPAVAGLLRTEILLPPATLERLDETELRLVLLHELAHLRRRDLWLNWLLALLQAVHWFNPVLWWAFHRVRVEAEGAADAWVLHRCGDETPLRYGEALLRLLEEENPPRRFAIPGVVGVVESPRDLRSRIQMIARFSRKRNRLAVVGTVGLIVGLAAVGLTQAPVEKEEGGAATVKEGENQSPPQKRSLICVVRDNAGDPAPGAQVFFQPQLSPMTSTPYPGEIISAVTDTEGKATVSLELVGDLPMELSGEWFARHETMGTAASGYRSTQAPVNPTELTLHEGEPMPLKVVDDKGLAISGLTMRAAILSDDSHFFQCSPSAELKGFWTATTDSKGLCLIPGIPVGKNVYVDHTDERYAQPEGRNHSKFRFKAANSEPHLIRLEPAATIAGRVVFPDGQPVAGAKVRALEQYHYTRGGCGDETTTDADGRYVLKRLLASRYDVGVNLPERLREEWAQTVVPEVSLEKGENLELPDIKLTRGALLTGRVTLPDSGEGVPNFIIGGTATSSTSPLIQWWATTDAGGHYRFRLLSGDRKVYLAGKIPDGYSRPKENEESLMLKEGARKVIDFTLGGPSVLSGRILDENGEPVAGATVRIWDFRPQKEGITGDDGRFRIEADDEAKQVPLIAYLDDQVSPEPVAVVPNAEDVEIRLRQNGFGHAEGRVIDESGEPLHGAVVSWGVDLSSPTGWKEVIVDETGRFRTTRLLPGKDVSFSAMADGHSSDSVQVEIESGKTVIVPDLVLRKAGHLVAGQVIDARGEPLGLAHVWVEGERQYQHRLSADSEGRFHIDGIVEGWLWVGASKTDRSRKIRVRSGVADAVIRLPEDPNPWKPEEIVDFIGKPAPPLNVEHWYHDSNPDPDHKGKIRMIRFVGKDRPLIYVSGTVKLMQKLQDEFAGKGVEFILVHGPWPKEEVDEILAADHPNLTVPLAIESEKDAMSDAFGVRSWLTVVIDREGKVVFQDHSGKGSKAVVQKLLDAEELKPQ